MTPTDTFFGEQLTRHIVAHLPVFASLRGVLAFSCDAEQWTVRLGDLETPVAPCFDADADLKLWFADHAFEHFLDGTFNPQELRLEGNLAVLERFGRFLTRSTSPLETRLQHWPRPTRNAIESIALPTDRVATKRPVAPSGHVAGHTDVLQVVQLPPLPQ